MVNVNTQNLTLDPNPQNEIVEGSPKKDTAGVTVLGCN